MGRGRGRESYRGYDVGCAGGRGIRKAGRRGASTGRADAGERRARRRRTGGRSPRAGPDTPRRQRPPGPRRARVPHGGTGREGRHHRAHPALLPGTQAHTAAPARGPHRLVRRHPPGPPAHHLGAPGTRPHPQRHRGAGRGLRPRARRGRAARPGRAHRGDPGPPLPEELADVFAGQATPENLAAALDLGYLGTDGGEIVHISRRLLDVSAALVREGIPLADVLRAARRVRDHTDALAELFTTLVLTEDRTPQDLQRLRPLAKSVVEAELSMALDRRLRDKENGEGEA